MSEFLRKKLSETRSIVDDMVFIAFEAEKNRPSDLIEEFQELEPLEIANVMDWKKDEKSLSHIEGGVEDYDYNFAVFLFQHGRTGFLARVHTPSRKKVDEGIHLYSNSIFTVNYVYADSLCELVDKIAHITEEIYRENEG